MWRNSKHCIVPECNDVKKIKVIFTIPNFTTAGSGREMLNIVEHLDKELFEVWIGVQSGGGKLFDEVIARHIPIVVQPFLLPENLPLLLKTKRARDLARDFKPLNFDVWISFNWSSDYSEAIVARMAGAKFVYIKKNMNWGRKAWKTKSLLAAAIIARNKKMLDTFFAGKAFKKKTEYITGGVDTSVFKPTFDMSVRRDLGIPDNAYLVSCVANIVRSKDQATLIKAVRKIDKAWLVLAGSDHDKEYKAELQKLVDKYQLNDRVIMTGNYSNINGLLNASNVFVLPTSEYGGHEEGCPVAVLEAMAAGVPCIVSNVAGNTDLIVHGKNGQVFKPGVVDALADCIRELILKPSYPKELAMKALDTVFKHHRIEQEAMQFEALIKKLHK